MHINNIHSMPTEN